ncbi:hypothetical protein IFM89_039487 [Coptis chinensis]|uniref:Histone acetyltransferase n=1 Tax=Coptis chinensis TaxID=261450 RepID=A0A835LLQ2_9MAGN|nr:hypothetical protein IFM89_039487 [Coptis chinensis]
MFFLNSLRVAIILNLRLNPFFFLAHGFNAYSFGLQDLAFSLQFEVEHSSTVCQSLMGKQRSALHISQSRIELRVCCSGSFCFYVKYLKRKRLNSSGFVLLLSLPVSSQYLSTKQWIPDQPESSRNNHMVRNYEGITSARKRVNDLDENCPLIEWVHRVGNHAENSLPREIVSNLAENAPSIRWVDNLPDQATTSRGYDRVGSQEDQSLQLDIWPLSIELRREINWTGINSGANGIASILVCINDARKPINASRNPFESLRQRKFCCMSSSVTGTRHPPGNEIYRSGTLSMFEVDGNDNRVYCQNLCYMVKLFLDHKTLLDDVDYFLFYILCECDDRGCHMVAYFSKEKQSEQYYNLACILTLPPYQIKGYGKFLIAFSYELSKKEGTAGTPEKPLSDLGKVSYKENWTRVLLEILKKKDCMISVRELSQTTTIRPDDVFCTLKDLNLIQYTPEGMQYVCTDHNILDSHLKAVGPGVPKIDASKLMWTPYKEQDLDLADVP